MKLFILVHRNPSQDLVLQQDRTEQLYQNDQRTNSITGLIAFTDGALRHASAEFI
jgi:hypothetical protein